MALMGRIRSPVKTRPCRLPLPTEAEVLKACLATLGALGVLAWRNHRSPGTTRVGRAAGSRKNEQPRHNSGRSRLIRHGKETRSVSQPVWRRPHAEPGRVEIQVD